MVPSAITPGGRCPLGICEGANGGARIFVETTWYTAGKAAQHSIVWALYMRRRAPQRTLDFRWSANTQFMDFAIRAPRSSGRQNGMTWFG